MSDKKRLFGTFGVRRTANDVLTPEFASRLAACYGTQIKGTVAVGGDPRTSTPMLKEAVKAGLLSSGCDVVDLGILPTPGVQYAVRKYYDGGVMITASHNPPQYNGLKFLDEFGIGIPDEMDIAIEKLYFDEEPKRAHWSEIGQIYQNDKIIDEYIDEAISKVDAQAIKDANLKVVVDCGSGAGSYTAPYLIRKLGCDVTTLNCQADGFFPGRDPEPIEENLQELISVVKELNADIGLAHDGDADRTICIDENGLFGGEENGGLIFPDFVYGRDAVMTVAKILETIAKEKKTLPTLVSELPVYYSSKMKIECSDDQKQEVMAGIAEEIKTTTDFELDLTDGVKILKEDGWVIIRPSGTEPIFRCFAESDSQEKADEMTEWGIGLIKKYKK